VTICVLSRNYSRHPEIPAKMLGVGYEYVLSLHHGGEEVARDLVCGTALRIDRLKEASKQVQNRLFSYLKSTQYYTDLRQILLYT
jgi:hypothetical protein